MQDIFISNGHISQLLQSQKIDYLQQQKNLLRTNQGQGIQIKQDIISPDDSTNIITLLASQLNYSQIKMPLKIRKEMDQLDNKYILIRNTQERKKLIQFQMGFLSLSKQSYQIKKDQNKIRAKFSNLSLIFSNPQENEQFEDLKNLFTFAIHMKNDQNRQQWIIIYQQMAKMVLSVEQKEMYAKISRWDIIETKISQLIQLIQKSQKLFFFRNQLQSYPKQFEQLLTIQFYCILAQRFNFSINEFYYSVFENKNSKPLSIKQKKIIKSKK